VNESEAVTTWPGPLSGLKVIDLTRVLAGPFVTQLLGDMGAEVIKIEPPHGDETRSFPPFTGSESRYFFAPNRNKKSVVLNLKNPEGVQVLRRLVERADVLVENYRPGVMDSLGLSYEALSRINPRLVYCAVSGFGTDGPLRDQPSFDAVTQALTGAMSLNGPRGGPPVKIGLPIGDLVAGVFAPLGILSAIHDRERTGRGRFVDVSLYDGMIGLLQVFAQSALATGVDPVPLGSEHPNLVPYNTYAASDGSIIVAALTDVFWQRLCTALERPDLASDPRFSSIGGRREHRDELDATVARIIGAKSVAHWLERLAQADVPHAPVLGVRAALAHPHALAREMVIEAVHPVAGQIKLVGRSVKFPGEKQAPLAAPPLLGEHTTEILAKELGMCEADISRLERSGAISCAASPTDRS
jgi:crotonobetainyl-CoA:carnitine CoA-transferase CaiB-like acyl-CoA transferase